MRRLVNSRGRKILQPFENVRKGMAKIEKRALNDTGALLKTAELTCFLSSGFRLFVEILVSIPG